MASLKSIRTRITSVKNTQKITRAMKLVSAARLRRAQEAITIARPYALSLIDLVAGVARRAGGVEAHPLLEFRVPRKVQLLLVTSDRGLAGAYNANICRAAERFLADHPGVDTRLVIVGKKGREHFRRRQPERILREEPGVTPATAVERSVELAHAVTTAWYEHDLDAVYVVYNEFKNAASQKVQVERLLPIEPRVLPPGATPTDYLYEPSKRAVLDRLLPMYAQVEILRALLEAIASELGARMSSMENATNNASEMISNLTLTYNRVRQAAITKELLEIIGGAEALKG